MGETNFSWELICRNSFFWFLFVLFLFMNGKEMTSQWKILRKIGFIFTKYISIYCHSHFQRCNWEGKTLYMELLVYFLSMMLIKCRIVPRRCLDLTGYLLQPLVFHETDTAPWAIFPSKEWHWKTHSASLVTFSAHSSADILTKKISRKLVVNATSGVQFIYPKARVRVAVKE